MRLAWLTAVALVLAGTAPAQRMVDELPDIDLVDADRLPVRAVNDSRPLTPELRLQYVLRQVDLPEGQADDLRQQATATLDSGMKGLAPQLVPLGLQWQQAREAKNDKQEFILRKEIEALTLQPFNDAIAVVRQALDADQAQRLDRAVQRTADVPSAALRPADMFNTAAALELDEETLVRLETYRAGFRERFGRSGPQFDTNNQRRAEALSRIYITVREALPDEKRPLFVRDIERMRIDRLPGIESFDAQMTPIQKPPRNVGGRMVPPNGG